MMSPWFASGTVTTSSLTGSSSTGPAFASASFSPCAAAVLNAISELSTECAFPSKQVTRTSTIGKPSAPPDSAVSVTPFSTAGMYWRGMTPPTILSTNSTPASALGRLDPQPRDRELPVTAALLLHLAFGFGFAADGLAVRDAYLFGLDLDAEFPRQALERDGEVGLAHAAEQRLVRLGVALDPEHRVFLLQPVQRVGELVLVGLGLGVDRHREQRFGQRERLDLRRRALGREHVAGREVVELGDRGDVAGRDLLDRVLLLAAHGEELVQALVGVRARVDQHLVVLHRTAEHLEEVHVTDVGVDDRLEHLHRGLPVVRARRGRFLDEELGEPVHADEPRRAPAEHREHARARRCRRRARARARRSRSSRRRGSAPSARRRRRRCLRSSASWISCSSISISAGTAPSVPRGASPE